MSSGIHEICTRPTLMVVDDDADIRLALADIFEEEGFRVIDLPDGECALRRLDEGELPTVMLLDLMMPRCSGWEVLAACAKSERLRHLPVLIMSALDPRSASLPLSIVGHVTKPLDVGALVDRIRDIAAASPGAPQVSRHQAV